MAIILDLLYLSIVEWKCFRMYRFEVTRHSIFSADVIMRYFTAKNAVLKVKNFTATKNRAFYNIPFNEFT